MKHYSLIDKVYEWITLELHTGRQGQQRGSGIDGETVEAFGENLEASWQRLIRSSDQDLTSQVRCDGGDTEARRQQRPPGIPTVRDRVVQQALLNVLQRSSTPIHPSTMGRPGDPAGSGKARFINRRSHLVDMDCQML